MKGCVYFHQGWTDLIICLPLIDHYLKTYDELLVILRSDAKEFTDFYLREKQNITPIYIKTDNGRYYGNIVKDNVNDYQYYQNGDGGLIVLPNDYDILFHAEHDRFRVDKYNHYWYRNNPEGKLSRHFSESFYTFYDIPYENRITNFNLNRDYELENKRHDEFVKLNGIDYVVYHDDESNHIHGSLHISTKITFDTIIENCNYVNLNKMSSIFFDYIKILENAKEIHLVDSIWAGICYSLDAKYGLFKNIKVYLYNKRDHRFMFENPFKLNNWEIV
jgi:hypothetical protein